LDGGHASLLVPRSARPTAPADQHRGDDCFPSVPAKIKSNHASGHKNTSIAHY
jgi:hypothetical protein